MQKNSGPFFFSQKHISSEKNVRDFEIVFKYQTEKKIKQISDAVVGFRLLKRMRFTEFKFRLRLCPLSSDTFKCKRHELNTFDSLGCSFRSISGRM